MRGRNSGLYRIVVLMVTMAVASWLIWWFQHQPVQSTVPQQLIEPSSAQPEALPPVGDSPFTNTSLNTNYTGAAACRECHADAHQSYLKTAHSQALAEVDLKNEPAGGEFSDPVSQKSYQIFYRDGKLIHQERIQKASGKSMVLCEFPARYTIGSGRFSRSYLVEIEGFLYESPATWYAARPGWALSPGYETFNPGFQRPVEFRCLFCHAGRVEPVNNSPQRVDFHSLVIDCERCHGPGGHHVEHWKHSAPALLAGEIDHTIVNPAHLDRQLHEDICAQCHLHSSATVELPDRRIQDFRPGLRLSDFVTHYGPEVPTDQMQVVGHVEQMRLSRCYQQSSSMTCTTCHHPHEKPEESQKIAFYRNTCLNCHTEQTCLASAELRHAEGVSDNCMKCHMPQSETDIPHFAFTHHRIGIHDTDSDSKYDAVSGTLIPMNDVSALPLAVQERNLGLAYLQLSDAPGQAQFQVQNYQKAYDLLSSSEQRRPNDADIQAGLARLFWGRDAGRTLQHAGRIAESATISPEAEATGCYTMGSTYYFLERAADAIPYLRRTTELRPTADVWHMLSDCLMQTSDLQGALQAAENAVALARDRPRFVQQKINVLLKLGRADEADKLQEIVLELKSYRDGVGY